MLSDRNWNQCPTAVGIRNPKAKIAYAWIDQDGKDDTGAIIETVLELPPVESPLSAVQTSMIADFMSCL
jgi:hypothetical protein